MLQCSALWSLSLGSTFSLSLFQFCISKRRFPPFSEVLLKIRSVRHGGPTVLQKWCICIWGSWVEGGVQLATDFEALDVLFCDPPEDGGSGKTLLCSVSGSK